MSSRSSVTAQKMIEVGPALYKSSLLFKHNKDSELKLLNSDKLRAKLSKNVRKMNSLTEQNDEIVELLKERGLSPAPAPDQTHCGAIKFTADRVELRDASGRVLARLGNLTTGGGL